ncbi:hypothetical protein TSAR_009923 [Trichomalopsis sarcophagae]|uniref:C2H2-type domain-containing protein n=1 Tax=Trichomalopsis sarcophagae TaxID=543379 RepID=A0A232F6A3_9HYME|nr:hypothetical protein TSAR_009923 [Trichomalopsis sarcophagae]
MKYVISSYSGKSRNNMAFSFRAGTNWCHDFPKLARESGFYFNMHTARVRVDWNRISSIDIDRVIRERDFQTVDENVNNVIDYYLESEYDVKILDPNFVKLFRLAQLAVEYLLYCKQYLDQSVVILKEELKYKIEDNIKFKEEVVRLQDTVKEMKEKLKEKSKAADFKSDSHGELHKCPHCPKAFLSSSFANAHVMRRHSNLSELVQSSQQPVHEEYRAETEKLHNEIKTLKERLNQTERVIRNESSKMIAQNEASKRERMLSSLEEGDSLHDDQYRRYQEEISNLKAMLFTEIRNIKRKDNNLNSQDNEINHESIKELVNQQENEIQRLKNQLQEHLTSNANEVQSKLVKQEDYWKAKIDQLENQHRTDIENLFTQLKLTQESANHMKSEYEEKVSFLEKQSLDQSKLLNAQSEQLNNLTKGMLDSQNNKRMQNEQLDNSTKGSLDSHNNKRTVENISDVPKYHKQRMESLTEDTLDSESNEEVNKKYTKKGDDKSPSILKSSQSYARLLSAKKPEEPKKTKSREEIAKESNLSKYKEKKPEKVTHRKITKAGNKYSSLDESDNSDETTATASETESDGDSDEETSESSATHTESTNDEAPSETELKPVKVRREYQNMRRRSSTISLETVRQDLQENFEGKLRDLGIDPEWDGIPAATFRQKLESIRHHQNISSKKFPKYEQIRRKILEEVTRRISVNQKSPKRFELEKKSFLNKAMKNVKSKALKALNEFKVQKGNETSTPVMSSKNSTPREPQPKRRFSLELLPKKPTQQDIQEIKRQTRLESALKQKRDEPPSRPKSGLHVEETVRQQVTETPKRTKLLQRSYQSIEEFMRDIDDSPKLDMDSTKVTSTPSRNVKNILQDTYNDSDGHVTKQDALWALASPKNNKSVLKSTNGTMNTLVKKKVLFDLEKEYSPDRESIATKSVGEFLVEESNGKKEGNDSDWNISSLSDEKEKITVKEKNASTENIQLKTSQSEKIAEISRKIQEKLEASRKKPAGSIEAMFSAKTFSSSNDRPEMMHQSSTDMPNSMLASLSSHIEPRPRSSTNPVPRPAPRRHMFETKDSDLDMDIDDLLAIKLKRRTPTERIITSAIFCTFIVIFVYL